jgi:nucleoside-diphosphate-sugar epimerase
MDVADGRVVPEFAAAALAGCPLPVFGDGRQTRSLCYVSDLVDALLLVAFDGEASGRTFNLGNPHEVTVLDLAAMIASAAGASGGPSFLPARPGDPARRQPDIARMRERYGWQPKVALEDGLRRTLAYFRELLGERELEEAA